MNKIPQEVNNIIFDLGGVLLHIDAQRSIKAFESLGLTNAINHGGWGYQHEVFLQMEKGLLSDEQFRNGIRELLPEPASDEAIDKAWCAMIIDFSDDRINLLHELKKSYKLYLFSNTNNIHLNHFQTLFQQRFGFPISDLFENDYYSHVLNQRKPSVESFQTVLNHAGLNPQETLFIDDSKENTLGAEKAGMHAVHLTMEQNLQALFGRN
ncbi:HAD family phosphatase [uncultured Sunxiuqinia sp.]|uniref:HAD family hydrolase n=1 Tax=uncultured Sunxiuqinia sp. TaxID=1573825 RepID=UPI0026390381|nr:HAD family phosphatase [uncultured Sunxiuqinia sp.]